jgi:hypothetical protein
MKLVLFSFFSFGITTFVGHEELELLIMLLKVPLLKYLERNVNKLCFHSE